MAIAIEVLSDLLEADEYLRRLLAAEAVNTSTASPVRDVQAELMPLLRNWIGGNLLSVEPGGAFVKGTAIRSSTAIDLLLSIAPAVRESMRELHDLLFSLLYASGYAPLRHNVSIKIRVHGYLVDLVLAHKPSLVSQDHFLYVSQNDAWVTTNLAQHTAFVKAAGRLDETRILKLWRNERRLQFPSFYLEMVVIRVLSARQSPYLSANVSAVFEYLRDAFPHARFVDPANANNVISDTMTANQKRIVSAAARLALATPRWRDIVR